MITQDFVLNESDYQFFIKLKINAFYYFKFLKN